MRLAARARRIAPSATMAAAARAKELQGQGVDIVLFDAGEPDFPTPSNVKDVGIAAIEHNVTKYSPVGGTLALRKAIATRLLEDENLDYAPEQILVGNGAKEVCYNVCQVLLESGDEALIPAPYWVSYAEEVRLADGAPIIVETDEGTGFKLTPALLEAAITPRTRLLFLNSPCNPTGTVYSEDEIKALGAVLAAHPGIVLLTDEIYKKVYYDSEGAAPSAAAVLRHLADQVILVDGASKAYAMTGWRVGFAAGPRDAIKAMRDLQSHSTSGTSSISQSAAVEAFGGDQTAVTKMRDEFRQRRDAIVVALNALSGVSCPTPSGAFYAYPNVKGALGRTYGDRRVETSLDLAAYLLDEAHVSVVPGEAFGTPGYLRLSYATSLPLIEEGMRRIAAALTREAPVGAAS